MKHNNPDLVLKGPQMLQPVREFAGPDTVCINTIWPSVVVQQQSNTLAIRHIVPRSPESYELYWTFFGYETDDEEMTARRLRQANLMGPAGLVSMDDGQIIERTQDGMLCGIPHSKDEREAVLGLVSFVELGEALQASK